MNLQIFKFNYSWILKQRIFEISNSSVQEFYTNTQDFYLKATYVHRLPSQRTLNNPLPTITHHHQTASSYIVDFRHLQFETLRLKLLILISPPITLIAP